MVENYTQQEKCVYDGFISIQQVNKIYWKSDP